MSKVTFTPAAAQDIDEIWDYTAENWGVDQADYYTDIIRGTCFGLADGKKLGRKVAFEGNFQKHLIDNHIIFFKQSEDCIDIIRILHQSMDFNQHL